MGKFAAAAILGLLVPSFNAPGVARDRLPVLGTVGDLPPEKETVIVEVLPAPALLIDGKQVDLKGFQEYLQPKADAIRETDGAKVSLLHVVIRADRDVFWQDVQWVLQACADPKIRVHRILFAAVPEDGGEEGAMAVFLPKDVGPPTSEPDQRLPDLPVRLWDWGDSPGPTGRALYAALAKGWNGRKAEFGATSLGAEPSVSTGAVLEAVDALIRWGTRGVVLRGTSLPTRGFNLRREKEVNSNPKVLVGSEVVVKPAKWDPAPSPLARVKGAMAGQTSVVVEGGGEAGGPFAGRRGGKPSLSSEGGGRDTDAAVQAGLEWLALHQSPTGNWDSDDFEARCKGNQCGSTGAPLYDPGLTGLSMLAFLGYGETHRTPRYGPVVRNGLKYLKGIQDEEGCFGTRKSGHFTYNHAMAALAFIEAFGLTQSPLLKASAQNGVDFIHQCQNPYLAWRYGVRPQDNDTSITGWMVMALHSAKGAGLDVDPATFEGAKSWLDKVTDPGDGRAGYTHAANGPSRPQELMDYFPKDRTESLTAVAVLTRIHCGARPDDEYVKKGLALCLKVPPVYDEASGSVDFYYWHFGSLALFQAGGDRWRTWNKAMKKSLLGSQRRQKDDHRLGSWDPVDPWGPDGGRIYATAINTLTLETYYRYARFAPRK